VKDPGMEKSKRVSLTWPPAPAFGDGPAGDDPVRHEEAGLNARDSELLDAYSRAVINVVETVGPARRAGLLAGDVIVTLNGAAVGTIDDIYRILVEWPAGEPITVQALRGKDLKEFGVAPAEAE